MTDLCLKSDQVVCALKLIESAIERRRLHAYLTFAIAQVGHITQGRAFGLGGLAALAVGCIQAGKRSQEFSDAAGTAAKSAGKSGSTPTCSSSRGQPMVRAKIRTSIRTKPDSSARCSIARI